MWAKRTFVTQPIVSIILVGAVLAASCQASTSTASSLPSTPIRSPAPCIGYPAPDFELATVDGSTVRLSDFRGHPVLINFWTIICKPCLDEMPTIEAVYESYQAEGLIVLGISQPFDTAKDIRQIARSQNLTYTLLLDTKSGLAASGIVQDAYQVKSFPSSFFLDRGGVIQSIYIGEMGEEVLEEHIREINEAAEN